MIAPSLDETFLVIHGFFWINQFCAQGGDGASGLCCCCMASVTWQQNPFQSKIQTSIKHPKYWINMNEAGSTGTHVPLYIYLGKCFFGTNNALIHDDVVDYDSMIVNVTKIEVTCCYPHDSGGLKSRMVGEATGIPISMVNPHLLGFIWQP